MISLKIGKVVYPFFFPDGNGYPGQLMCTLTIPLSDPVKCRPSTPGPENSLEISLLRYSLKRLSSFELKISGFIVHPCYHLSYVAQSGFCRRLLHYRIVGENIIKVGRCKLRPQFSSDKSETWTSKISLHRVVDMWPSFNEDINVTIFYKGAKVPIRSHSMWAKIANHTEGVFVFWRMKSASMIQHDLKW